MATKDSKRGRTEGRSAQPSKSLVEQNQLFLFMVILLNFFCGFYISGAKAEVFKLFDDSKELFNTIDLSDSKIQIVAGAVLSAVIAGIMTFVNGLLSVSAKNAIVFWGPLPSDEAFTKLAPNVHQVDLKQLKREYGKKNLPSKPSAQTNFWFRLYNRYRNDAQLLYLNRSFLLMRDWCGFSILVVLLGIPIAVWLSRPIGYAVFYSVAVLAQYLLTMVAARNYGKQLVIEVLIVASHVSQRRSRKS